MKKNTTLLFVSTANLTTNPRCLKEIKLANSLGYNTIAVFFKLGDWSETVEEITKKEIPNTETFYLDATKNNFIQWFYFSFLHLIICKLLFLFKNNRALEAYSINKRSIQLSSFLRKKQFNADIVIAHNLGAFYPATLYSKQRGIKLGIDVEDYHAGETSNIHQKNRVENLMLGCIKHASYISLASPLFLQELINIGFMPTAKLITTTVNNVFSEREFVLNTTTTKKLQLVWFSQNIDYGRGLEKVFPYLDSIQHSIQLTLIGNIRNEFYETEVKSRSYLKVIEPLPQKRLNKLLCTFDVGLAIEDISADENRRICLTNKIWSYYQAGLFIFASKTPAQIFFTHQYCKNSVLFDMNDSSDVIKGLTELVENMKQIQSSKEDRYKKALAVSWEKESIHLVDIWKSILN